MRGHLDFRDATIARIFEETHNLATWVVNYDELLDRRQLVEQGVRIIRYKQIGPITEDAWQKEILPRVKQLNQ